MLGIDIRELSCLKLLQPICDYFISAQVPYILYNCDMPRGSKEYNRASAKNIKLSSKRIINRAQKVRPYSSNKQLIDFLRKDKIGKFLGVELSLCYGNKISKLNNVKLYSILYLTDSIWSSKKEAYEINRTYFGSRFLMNTALDFSGAKYDKEKHRCLGLPVFDQLKNIQTGDNTLVLLPNLRSDHVEKAFGSAKNFISMMAKLSEKNNLIYKTRKKQWLPKEIIKYASEIINDGPKMYPSAIVSALDGCKNVVMFYSSGIYEMVVAGKYVVNIPLPLKRWGWDKSKMGKYFSKSPGSLYNFNGVVESVEQSDIISGNFDLATIEYAQRNVWVNKFSGPVKFDSAKKIAMDVIKI